MLFSSFLTHINISNSLSLILSSIHSSNSEHIIIHNIFYPIRYPPPEDHGPIHIHAANFQHCGGRGVEACLDSAPVVVVSVGYLVQGGVESEADGGNMDIGEWPIY